MSKAEDAKHHVVERRVRLWGRPSRADRRAASDSVCAQDAHFRFNGTGTDAPRVRMQVTDVVPDEQGYVTKLRVRGRRFRGRISIRRIL